MIVLERQSIVAIGAGLVAVLAWGGAHVRPVAQGRALEAVPIVGHWEHQTEGSEPVVRVDAAKWNRQPAPDIAAIARRIFKQPADGFDANASSGEAFPVAVVRGVENVSGGTVRVQFKLVAGASDQTAGLMFDLRPNGEYLVARYNTKDGNVAVWKYAKGTRARLANGTTHEQLPLDTWHTLVLRIAGKQIVAVVNDRLQVEHTLDHPVSGPIGFWAKRDSVSAFKNLRLE
jgi:hypothetical protein